MTVATLPVHHAAAKARPGRKGPSLALRNWRVPWRLIALIAIPTVVAMAFAGLRVEAAANSAATFGRSAQLAVLGQQVTALAQAIEDERDLTATFIANGRPAAGRAALRRQYAVTDALAQAVRTQIQQVGRAFPAQTRADAADVIARIGDLPGLRSYAGASDAPAFTAVTAYTLANADLFTLDDDIAQQAGKFRAGRQGARARLSVPDEGPDVPAAGDPRSGAGQWAVLDRHPECADRRPGTAGHRPRLV